MRHWILPQQHAANFGTCSIFFGFCFWFWVFHSYFLHKIKLNTKLKRVASGTYLDVVAVSVSVCKPKPAAELAAAWQRCCNVTDRRGIAPSWAPTARVIPVADQQHVRHSFGVVAAHESARLFYCWHDSFRLHTAANVRNDAKVPKLVVPYQP